jgi:hypothetical protein
VVPALQLKVASFALPPLVPPQVQNADASWLSSAGIAIEAGVLFAAAYVAFRSLWVPIGMHWAWNLFEGPVFGTPVSGMSMHSLLHGELRGSALVTGGAFGPEAGLVCIGLGALLGGFFLWLAIRRGEIFTPPWVQRMLRRRPPAAPPAPAVAAS